MISISNGLVLIYCNLDNPVKLVLFSSQRPDKKKLVAILSGDAYKGNGKKKFQFRVGTNDQTADFFFENGRINKPFAMTAVG